MRAGLLSGAFVVAMLVLLAGGLRAGEWQLEDLEYWIPGSDTPTEPNLYMKEDDTAVGLATVYVTDGEGSLLYLWGSAFVQDMYLDTLGQASASACGAVKATMTWVPDQSEPPESGNIELWWMADSDDAPIVCKGWAETDCQAWALLDSRATIDSDYFKGSDSDKWLIGSHRKIELPQHPAEGKELITTALHHWLTQSGLPGGYQINPEAPAELIDVAFDRGEMEWAQGSEAKDLQATSASKLLQVGGPNSFSSVNAKAFHSVMVGIGGRGDGEGLFDDGDFYANVDVTIRTTKLDLDYSPRMP